ncbi:SAR2788 family putative toxin [Macrococcoides bohemicum]|uniref:SAR2788 family putative toxin n=1 Tax=Macrococcoides bohemicum TaxID=1903056 RepID=A0AAJ4PBD0_9STAP|nr:SAR2788 family putative toxin [Macrococcus bohemicus]QYA42440.1 SAR2788 family putative toxin [Macrococcus bohemicus]
MKKTISKTILIVMSFIMTTTIFGGLELSAAENEYDFSNLKVESVSKDEIDNLSKVIEIHENKNSETLNIIGESEDTNFELNYDIENNEGNIVLDDRDNSFQKYSYSIVNFVSEDDYEVIVKNLDNNEEIIYSAKEFNASNPLIIGFIIRYGIKQAIKKYGKDAVRLARLAVTKSNSPVWKKFKSAKNGRKTSGSGKNKRYYEWDNRHKEIEVYNSNGVHIGVMDPLTGQMTKPAVKGRKIKV